MSNPVSTKSLSFWYQGRPLRLIKDVDQLTEDTTPLDTWEGGLPVETLAESDPAIIEEGLAADLVPDGIATPDSWAGCVSATWTCLDDGPGSPLSESSFASAVTVGTTAWMTMQDLPANAIGIRPGPNIELNIHAQTSPGGTVGGVALLFRVPKIGVTNPDPSDPTDYEEREVAQYATTGGAWLTNSKFSLDTPVGPWTVFLWNEVNMGIRVKVAPSVGEIRVSDVWADITFEILAPGGSSISRYRALDGTGSMGAMNINPME